MGMVGRAYPSEHTDLPELESQIWGVSKKTYIGSFNIYIFGYDSFPKGLLGRKGVKLMEKIIEARQGVPRRRMPWFACRDRRRI